MDMDISPFVRSCIGKPEEVGNRKKRLLHTGQPDERRVLVQLYMIAKVVSMSVSILRLQLRNAINCIAITIAIAFQIMDGDEVRENQL